MLHHRDRGIPIDLKIDATPLSDLAEAYEVQDAADEILRAERRAVCIGYKIAGTNAAARKPLGIAEPFYGRLYDAQTSPSPASLPKQPAFFRLIEPEIAVQIDRDLDPSEAPFRAETIEQVTRAIVPAIEIIGTHFKPWTQGGALNFASDNAVHGHWIMGMPITDWSSFDLMDDPIELKVDGDVAATGSGRNVDDGAFGATAWLANALAARGRGLKAGDYITTGSATPPLPIDAQTTIIASFGTLGSVELRFSGE
ncbi:MAG: 2-keto-4-pentenoate hydratase [Geminicoccaceae bacterium]